MASWLQAALPGMLGVAIAAALGGAGAGFLPSLLGGLGGLLGGIALLQVALTRVVGRHGETAKAPVLEPRVAAELAEAELAIARLRHGAGETKLPGGAGPALHAVASSGAALVEAVRRDPRCWSRIRGRALHGLRDAAVIADGLVRLAKAGRPLPPAAVPTLAALAAALDGAGSTALDGEVEAIEARLRLLEQELGPPPWAGEAARAAGMPPT